MKQLRGSRKLSKVDYDTIRRVDELHCTKWRDCDRLKAQAESEYAKNYIERKKEYFKYLEQKK